MFKVSEIITTPPEEFSSELQRKVYETFEALGIPRVSFAPADKLLELTGVLVGATTILSAILPECSSVHLILDKDIAGSGMFACTDGTATCFVKIKTEDLLGKFIPSTGHKITLI